ncbi:NADPH oxidase 4-like isoform X3 [Chironomus tepperi]|uniref:NADPH oxidase 4-like isoform X3 n=1 Tax=Chironomus tepperi TaxID=113505 RepID=UPI00391EEA0F
MYTKSNTSSLIIEMNATLDDDKETLENIRSSAKKFFHRYILLMIFIIGILLVLSFSYYAYTSYNDENEKFYYLKKIIGKGLYLSNATVFVINFLIIAIIFPVCRTFNTFIHKTFNRIFPYFSAIYMEKLKVVHQVFALSLIYISFIHIALHFTNAINFIKNYDAHHKDINWSRGHDDNVFRLMFLTPVGFSGWTMVGCLIIMWIFSSRQMRNYFYNSFMGIHYIFFLFFIMLYYHPLSDVIKYQDNVKDSPPICDIYKRRDNETHAKEYMEKYCKSEPKFTAGRKNFWIWPTITLVVFFLDHLIRYFKRFFSPMKLVEVTLPTRNSIFLTFKINDNIALRPGQYILLQCENISTIEWHPFFITDFVIEPRKTIFTLAITVRGDWTCELYEKLFELKMYSEKSNKRKSNRSRRKYRATARKLNFIFDGPYSNHMESILSREHVVLIGQGIGITPFISIFNYVMKSTQPTIALKRIHLVWIARDIKQFTLFLSTLCELTQMVFLG